MSFYPRQLSTIIFIIRSSSFLSGKYKFSEKEGNSLKGCSDMTVMGNVMLMYYGQEECSVPLYLQHFSV